MLITGEAWVRNGLVAMLAVGASTLGFADLARAGMVRLNNGDIVTGKILSVSDGKIIVETEHSGEVTVDVEYVVDIESEEMLTVEFEDGREVTGYVDVGPDGRLIVQETAPAAAAEAAADVAELPALDLSEVAQVREVKPFFYYVANVQFGLNIASGNSDSEYINFAAGFVPTFGKNTILLDGQYNHGKADGQLAASNWRINGQYEREFWDDWFWFLFNSYEHDRLQELDLRITAATGLGYWFFRPDPTLLKVSLGPAFVDENFEEFLVEETTNDTPCDRDTMVCVEKSDDRQFAALRWALDFDQDLWSPDLSIYHNHRMTFGLTEDQFIILTAQGLRVGLIADFALLLEFQFDHNGNPAAGAEENDYRYLVKLAYDFAGDGNDLWH